MIIIIIIMIIIIIYDDLWFISLIARFLAGIPQQH